MNTALGSHGAAIALFLGFVEPAFDIHEARALRMPAIVDETHRQDRYTWPRDFSADRAFAAAASQHRDSDVSFPAPTPAKPTFSICPTHSDSTQ